MTRRSYTGAAAPTTLAAPIVGADASLTLAASSNLPSSNFVITVDQGQAAEEKILVGARSGVTCSGLTRGFDGTSAAAHSAGATVIHTISATDLDEANAHVNASSGVHGLAGAVVGTSDAQTLTNKTLTTPTIGSFVNAQHTHASTAGGGLIAASLDPQTRYFLHTCPPANTVGEPFSYTTVGSAGYAGSPASVSGLTTSSGGGTNYITGYRAMFDPNLTTVSRTGNLQINARCALDAIVNSNFNFSISVTDGTDPIQVATNGAAILVNGAGAVSTLKRVASASTAGTTTASPVAAHAYHDFRINYPQAGGTATVYMDGVQVGTIATVPALTTAWVAVSVYTNNGTNGTVYIAQTTITD